MKRKRRQEFFAFYDDTSLKNHLEKMAKKGWMIEKMNNYFWTYVRTEPKDITFEITYHSSASEFDPHRSDEQMTFDEFCEHTGWNLALSWHQMQIYYNERQNPTPIQTDPVLRLELMHRAMWSNYLRGYIIMLIIALPLSVLFLISLINSPQAVINGPGSSVYAGTLMSLLSAYIIFDFYVYFSWRKKALVAAENGEFLPSPNTTAVQKAVIYITYSAVGIWFTLNLIKADMIIVLSMLTYFVSFIISFAVIDKTKDVLKSFDAPRTVNKILSAVVTFIVAFVMIRLFVYIILILSGNGDLTEILF